MHEPRSVVEGLVVVDLFSGPGGLSLGFKQAGFSIGLGIEDDVHASETYKRNFPEAVAIAKKVEDVRGKEIIGSLSKTFSEPKILVVGGPPCQPFSNANMHKNQRGPGHPSASSVDHFARLIREVIPDAFLMENVTTFELMNGSTASFLQEMKQLGYHVSSCQLEAHKYGVPQHRRRFFLGGMMKRDKFSLPESHQRSLTLQAEAGRTTTVKQAISDLPDLPRGGGGSETRDYPKRSGELHPYQKTSRAGSLRIFNHLSTVHSQEVQETMSYVGRGLSLTRVWKSLPQRVRDRYENADSIQGNIYYRLSWNAMSPTIVHPRRAMLLHPKMGQSRIISVREAARLQSFPDTFRFCGGLDSQYQQVANAVPPRVARALALIYKHSLGSHLN